MPQIRSYDVIETRVVRVDANSAADAAALGAHAFRHGQNSDDGLTQKNGIPDVWGNTTTRIRTTSLTATEL